MLRPEFKAISNIVKAYGEKLKKKASVVEAWPCFPFFGGREGVWKFPVFGFWLFWLAVGRYCPQLCILCNFYIIYIL